MLEEERKVDSVESIDLSINQQSRTVYNFLISMYVVLKDSFSIKYNRNKIVNRLLYYFM